MNITTPLQLVLHRYVGGSVLTVLIYMLNDVNILSKIEFQTIYNKQRIILNKTKNKMENQKTINLSELSFNELEQLIELEQRNMINNKHTEAYTKLKQDLRQKIESEATELKKRIKAFNKKNKLLNSLI
jgi:hypothetical protein